MASTGVPPGLVLYQEQTISKPLKDFFPLLPTTGSRHDLLRSKVLLPRLDVQDNLFRSGSESYGYNQFSNSPSVRRMPLADLQDVYGDSILLSHCMDEQCTKDQEIWQFLLSRTDELREDNLLPSFVPRLKGLQALPADMYLQHVTCISCQSDKCVDAKEFFLDAGGNSHNQDNGHNLVYNVPRPRFSIHLDGRLSWAGTETDMKDLASVLAEFAVSKESAQSTKQKILVPHFRWNDTLDLQDLYPSSMMLGTVTSAPLKSPQKQKPTIPKRKTKKAVRERDLYRNNSLHPFETILSIMVNKKRNAKSMMNSLKKAGPEVPQFLTQSSATIMGTGLAVMFSVLYKVACGSVPLCASNILTSGVGIGLFWISWSVNRLRDTILDISKKYSKTGFEEEEMMVRVDRNVSNIVFRAAVLMAVLMLRLA